MRVAFCTLGCKVNYYETQAMEQLFVQKGYEIVPFEESADIYIVNTCTVTQISDKKSRQMLSRAHNLNPDALVVAVGCYAEIAKESVSELDGVSLVIGTEGRKDIVHLCEQALGEASVQTDYTKPFERREFEELSATTESRTRAVLKIQDGCDYFCSYCAIPYARGRSRSRKMESCEKELRSLALQGYREVVLTGIQLSEYGADLDTHPDLCDVIRLADSIPGISRVRLGSLEPGFIDRHFIESVSGCKSLCHQFHLSLQSGCDTVLKRMHRRYTTEEYRNAVNLLREAFPDTAITTDIIAGFVGETEEEHKETIRFIQDIGFSRIHVFPYSIRKGTKAAAMPNHLPKRIKESRAKELIEIGRQMEQDYLNAMIGSTVEVLLEERGIGYSGNYIRVATEGNQGEIVRARICLVDGLIAIGHTIETIN